MRTTKHRTVLSGSLRIAVIFAGVFGVGVGLGAGIGVWLTNDERPNATVTLNAPDQPPVELTSVAPIEPSEQLTIQTPTPAPKFTPNPTPPPVKVIEPDVSVPVPETGIPAAIAPFTPPTPPSIVTPPNITTPLEAVAPKTGWRKHAVDVALVPGKPMIAIVLDDLGIDQKRSRNAIALPGPLTLSFIPYGYNLPALTKLARESGHELLVHVNMEPLDRGVDPGPNALLTSLTSAELRRRLTWALSRFEGFTGINNHMGSRFTAWPEGMEIVLQALNEKGLLFLDSLTNTHSVGPALARAYKTPYAVRDVFIDHDRTDAFVQKQLALTERLARRNGHAIAIGHPHDVTLKRLKDWLATIEARGFTLVPVSAIVRAKAAQG